MPAPAPAPQPTAIGRFVVLRPLGQGAQGVVYLAHDPSLDRLVALKTLTAATAMDCDQAGQLLQCARTASHLSHPNIVPVFEVGMHHGRPYAVFEYVEGVTLRQLLASKGPLPLDRAVVTMSQILAGIAHVHASGLLHGDLTPANILLGPGGIPRVTDFGISRRATVARQEATAAGTLQYMPPECFGDAGADYRSDVFALGAVFYELLTGEAAFGGDNEYATIHRVLHETPSPPSQRNPRIDARIDRIVLKALAKNPQQRYPDAAAMKAELDRIRVASGESQPELDTPSLHSTVEFLLRRMSLKKDFPTLSASIARVNQLSQQADKASLKALAELVLRDFSLTQKLLRLVNTASLGAGKIKTVSEAIAVLGVAQLRTVAIGLMLASSARGARDRSEVTEALVAAFVTGLVACNLGRAAGQSATEELFLCGMFSRLGDLLVLYYLPEEYTEIDRRARSDAIETEGAAQAVLGLTLAQLGADVARRWSFPESIVQTILPLADADPASTGTRERQMHCCAEYARELCRIARHAPSDARETRYAELRGRMGSVVPVAPDQMQALLRRSMEIARQYCAAADIAHQGSALLEGIAALSEIAAPRVQVLEDQHPRVPPAPGASSPAPECALAPATHHDHGGPDRHAVTSRLMRAWRALF